MPNRRSFLQSTFAATIATFLQSFKSWSIIENTSYNILLGKPTNNSICLNIFLKEDAEILIEYGKERFSLNNKTTIYSCSKNNPVEIILNSLDADSTYFYRLCIKNTDAKKFSKETLYSFKTQKKKGKNFVFTITADSHLGTTKHCNPDLYQLTLNNVAKDEPDLHFALGDEFRASKVNNPNYHAIEQLYFNQREHLKTLFHSIPYFFILGNHEMEAKAYYDNNEESLAAWSLKARKKFITNPHPNHFYTGNKSNDVIDGNRQNYYAFEWGDVLFVTLDVFWYSNISAEDEEMREKQKDKMENLSKEERIKIREERQANKEKGGKGEKGGDKKRKDQWSFTLGEEQYQWLKQTLEKSKAKYKIVLGHHVMGSCRGGIEWASTFEWGGLNRKGINEFKQHRPNWEKPIHQLFIDNKVNAFIQGHDHLFARQELDGINYITCPMCGDPGYNTYNAEAFTVGDKLSNTGHLKFSVTEKDIMMEYIKAVLPNDEAVQGKNGNIVYKWSIINKKKLS